MPAKFLVGIGVRVLSRCVVPSKMTSILSGLRARPLHRTKFGVRTVTFELRQSSVLALFENSYHIAM